jgi:hypothetical protein
VSRMRLQYFREGEVELARPDASTRVCSYTSGATEERSKRLVAVVARFAGFV